MLCVCYMRMLMSSNDSYCEKSLTSKLPSVSLCDYKQLCLSDFLLSDILKDIQY